MKRKSQSATLTTILSILSLGIASVISVAGPKDPFGGGEVKILTTDEKMKSLLIPALEFQDTPFLDALAFIQQRSVELDPSSKGINIINQVPAAGDTRITLKLSNVPVSEALRYTASLAQTSFRVDKNAVVIVTNEEAEKTQTQAASGTDSMEEDDSVNGAKLREIIFPALEFVDTPILDAFNFIQQKSMELDEDKSPDTRGINIVLENPEQIKEARITLRLRNVPLGEVLRYTTTLANTKYVVEENAILIKPN